MPDQPPQPREAFRSTKWSMILMASDLSSPAGEAALAKLCKQYWYPLYAFARRSGWREHDAEDLTQGFFVHLMSSGMLERVAPRSGRFRSFLLTCLRNFLTNEWRRQQSAKRGGGMTVMAFESEPMERRYAMEVSTDETPERLYERRWAEAVMDRAVTRLRDEWVKREKPFDVLKPFLLDAKGTYSFSSAADQLGVSEAALKSTVHRMRQRFGDIFRDEVLKTVESPRDVDDEIRHLLASLAQ